MANEIPLMIRVRNRTKQANREPAAHETVAATTAMDIGLFQFGLAPARNSAASAQRRAGDAGLNALVLAPATSCRHCGCTDDRACRLVYRTAEARLHPDESCWWIGPGLCSNPACLDAEVLQVSERLDELRELANQMRKTFSPSLPKKTQP